jgi:hypothetical protein
MTIKLISQIILLVWVMIMGNGCSDKKSSAISPMGDEKSTNAVPTPEHVLRSTIEVVEHPAK